MKHGPFPKVVHEGQKQAKKRKRILLARKIAGNEWRGFFFRAKEEVGVGWRVVEGRNDRVSARGYRFDRGEFAAGNAAVG